MINDYNIYINIHKFIKYRYNANNDILSEREFTKIYTSNKYIDIEVGDSIVIIMTLDNSDYSSINAATKKLLMKFIKATPTPKELILISNFNFRAINNGVIADLVSAKKLINDLTSSDSNLWIQIRPKTVFYMDIPSATIVPKHRRIDQDNFYKVTSKWIDVKTLQLIDEFDPGATWIGARVGEIIEIDRYSPSTGKSSIYRRVK